MGNAIEEEWGDQRGGWQDFERGVKLWDAKNNRTLILYPDGTWEAIYD